MILEIRLEIQMSFTICKTYSSVKLILRIIILLAWSTDFLSEEGN